MKIFLLQYRKNKNKIKKNKMSEEISVYNALVTPVNGTDPPLDQTLDYIKQGLPFKTLDYLYRNFRVFFPPESFVSLTVNVLLGTASLSLTDISYDLLIISNSTNNAKVVVQGVIGKSIQLNSIKFDINIDIIVPYQPFITKVRDVPVITSADIFIVNKILNIITNNSDISQLSMSRDIIVSEGSLSLDMMDSQNSIVNINIPYSIVFYSKVIARIPMHRTINLNIYSNYLKGTLSQLYINIRDSVNLVYYPPPPDYLSNCFTLCLVNLDTNNDSLLFEIFNRLNISFLFFVDGWIPVSIEKCNVSLIDLSTKRLDFKQKMKRLLDKVIFKTFLKAVSINPERFLQESTQGVVIQGSGTFEYTGETVLSLTSIPATILGVNLIGFKPYLDTSEYSLIQDNDSYNNSGSIFRRAHVITSDYTLTQFDGAVFLVDASRGNITITIPIGDVSNNRLMEFKRIDTSSNTVIITSPGGIDLYKVYKLDTKKCKDGCKSKKLAYIRLFGDGIKLWILQ